MAKKKEKGLTVLNARIVYDEETKSMYVYLPKSVHVIGGTEPVAKSRELKGPVVLDYNGRGELMGLELLGVALKS
jgi:uncharacterized protein YuzE